MDTETSDVVGYAPAIDYSFDRYEGNSVHVKKIAKKSMMKNYLENDTHVDIVTVDLFKKSSSGEKYYATKRTYAVIPDSDGDGNDALVYSGSLKAVTGLTVGNVTFAGGDLRKRPLQKVLTTGNRKGDEPMSYWKYNDVELDVDMADAEFQEKYENAFEKMEESEKTIKKDGKISEITRAYCSLYTKFV